MWVERVFKENVHLMDNNIDVLIILLYTTTQSTFNTKRKKRGRQLEQWCSARAICLEVSKLSLKSQQRVDDREGQRPSNNYHVIKNRYYTRSKP